MDDKKIIGLLFARSETGLQALAQRFGARLHTMAMNILGVLQDAEECVNDTYLAIWNVIPPQRPIPLAPYVFRVGRNIALKRLRANTAGIRNSSYDLSLDELADCIPDKATQRQQEARELSQAIDRFLGTQSKENRVIFLRRYWFGDSVSDISDALGIRPGTVSTRLNRMRNALKKYLAQEGVFL